MRIKTIGIIIMGIGILLGVTSRFFCGLLCEVCLSPEVYPCFYLLLFSGILLIIAGYSMTTLKEIVLPGFKFK